MIYQGDCLEVMKNHRRTIYQPNLLDLFSGIGGFHLGLDKAGFKFKEIYYSDIDKYANAVYKHNFPKSKELGDVKTINANELPKGRWFVTFGFPCQDLSVAGKRAGFEGKRSSLFYEAIRIIRDLQPEVFIFENVKGIFSANQGQDFIAVLREIADIGLYDCEWQLVNTRWVLPQNRERIYFIGHLRGKSKPKVFPIRESHENVNKGRQPEENEIAQCVRASGNDKLKGSHIQLRQIGLVAGKDNMGQRIYDTDGIATSIRAEGGGQGAKTGLYKIHNSQGGIVYGTNDIYPTIPSQKQYGGNYSALVDIKDNHNIRRLTPIECERLQGFPDNFTKYGNFDGNVKEISDTQRYKMLGNAVSIPIVKLIGIKLNGQEQRS